MRKYEGFLLCSVLFAGCGGTPVSTIGTPGRSIDQVSETTWNRLSEMTVYFGHQSVGSNIMQGVSDLIAAQPKLGIVVRESDGSADPCEGCFAHSKLGKNGDAKIKTDAFAALMEGGLGDRVDIAFHKYCFADIYAGTEVASIFEHYKKVMARLRAEYPRVTFVHVTIPLMVVQSGPKAVIKKLLGRMPDNYADNMRREEFNDLMRREFQGEEPLFDLAVIESTRPDGTREIIEFRGNRSFALVPGYSDDGAHLNDTGRRRVAGTLLVALAELADRQ